jgi:exodeoxyribonuclease VII large subunit
MSSGSAQIELRFDERPPALSVSDAVRAAGRVLEGRFSSIVVEGEISNLKRHASGHLYFTMKDDEAQLPAVMWRSNVLRMRFTPADGSRVRCRGTLSIFEPQGKFQLYAETMDPTGLGAAQLAFEELRRKLAAEGLFADERKRRLPFWPRRIGVVTSPSGAAIRDIIRVVHRRAAVPIVLAPAAVQGDGAAHQLTRALRAVSRLPGVDVIILGRGGGSAEDLSAFNDEVLARAVAQCPVPVVSAIGHEVDYTLCDFVADLRVATPSMAGERVVPVQVDLHDRLVTVERRLLSAVQRSQREAHARLEILSHRVGDPTRRVGDARQRLEQAQERSTRALSAVAETRRRQLRALEVRLATHEPAARLHARREQLGALTARLNGASRSVLTAARHAVERHAGALHALSPLAVLDRGYALARRPDGGLLSDASSASPGEPFSLTLRDGRLDCRVVEKHPDRESLAVTPPSESK